MIYVPAHAVRIPLYAELRVPDRPLQPMLPPRRRACLLLAANGKNDREIANEMHISINTVKKHLALALRSLGARNGAHAVAICMRAREFRPEEIADPRGAVPDVGEGV